MHWHDYLALAIVAVAAVAVVLRGYRSLFGRGKPGCGAGCGSCSAAGQQQPATLLSIGPPRDDQP